MLIHVAVMHNLMASLDEFLHTGQRRSLAHTTLDALREFGKAEAKKEFVNCVESLSRSPLEIGAN